MYGTASCKVPTSWAEAGARWRHLPVWEGFQICQEYCWMNGRNSFFGVYITPSFEIQLKARIALSSPEWLERGQLNVGLVDSPAGISSPTPAATSKL